MERHKGTILFLESSSYGWKNLFWKSLVLSSSNFPLSFIGQKWVSGYTPTMWITDKKAGMPVTDASITREQGATPWGRVAETQNSDEHGRKKRCWEVNQCLPSTLMNSQLICVSTGRWCFIWRAGLSLLLASDGSQNSFLMLKIIFPFGTLHITFRIFREQPFAPLLKNFYSPLDIFVFLKQQCW